MPSSTIDQRRSPRARIELECTLRRRSGNPVSGHTVDLGPGGMCVWTARPLAADEVIFVEVPPRISGRARVLRQQTHETYAVRFEALSDSARAELERLTR